MKRSILCAFVLGLTGVEALSSSSSFKATTPSTTAAAASSSSSSSSTAPPPTDSIHKSRLEFPGLPESKFRHPLDRDLTRRIQQLPGNRLLEQGLRRGFPLLEQGVRLDLLSTTVKVSPQQLPELHQAMVQAGRILDFDTTPDLYLQSNPQANAYTLAFLNRDAPPIVVITSALLERCTTAEIQAVLGHELGHLKCEHSLYLTLGGLASTPIRNVPILGPRVDEQLRQWRLAAEYTCDRAALLVSQDVEVVVSGLLKLFAGTSAYDMNAQSFIDQCREYDQLLQSANPLVRASIQRQVRTHPLPVRRVAQLKEWSESVEYKDILRTFGTDLDETTKKIVDDSSDDDDDEVVVD